MEFETASSTMHLENCSIKIHVNNDHFSLFDKNLKRLNDNIKSVNEYYTPKFHHQVESIQNNSKVKVKNELHEPCNEKLKQTINFYNEFHKIAMHEIESIRKTEVRSKLNMRINDWEQKRKECSNTSINIDEESKRLVRENLAIDRNYKKILQDSNNDQFQTRLCDEQNEIDQKKRNIKFNLILNHALNLLTGIKKLLNESQMTPQSHSNQMNTYMLFEVNINEFKNAPQNADEQNLLSLCQTAQNIKNFYEQLMINLPQKTQFENVPDKIDNFKFNSTKNDSKTNNYFEETKNEINNFTFKMDEKPDIQSAEFFAFKFKTDEKVIDSEISNFSFSKKLKEIEKNTSYDFKNDYKQFLENHQAIQKYLKEIESKYSSFLIDDNLKSLKRELIKAIYTPVNCISSTTPWHMKDKFDKLDALLKCKTVETGNSRVSANSHKDALTFCKHTLAKKLVNFGENVADVKKQAAFEVASIASELWQVHSDFGLILYATFKQKCPCLIPYNAPQTNEQTDEEYYKSLGYNYTNGVVEKQDKYVKRMTGIIRLFAAIIVTETKSGKALGIEQAWILIAATVNLAPQLDVTAVFLHEMLIITGHDLKEAYGRQLIKMLKYIDTYYMKKIDEVTPITCAGPVQRFKTFISKAIEVGYIEKPKDIIPYNFW